MPPNIKCYTHSFQEQNGDEGFFILVEVAATLLYLERLQGVVCHPLLNGGKVVVIDSNFSLISTSAHAKL